MAEYPTLTGIRFKVTIGNNGFKYTINGILVDHKNENWENNKLFKLDYTGTMESGENIVMFIEPPYDEYIFGTKYFYVPSRIARLILFTALGTENAVEIENLTIIPGAKEIPIVPVDFLVGHGTGKVCGTILADGNSEAKQLNVSGEVYMLDLDKSDYFEKFALEIDPDKKPLAFISKAGNGYYMHSMYEKHKKDDYVAVVHMDRESRNAYRECIVETEKEDSSVIVTSIQLDYEFFPTQKDVM